MCLSMFISACYNINFIIKALLFIFQAMKFVLPAQDPTSMASCLKA